MEYNTGYSKLNTFYLLLWQSLSEVEPLSDENRWLRSTPSISKERRKEVLEVALKEVEEEYRKNASLEKPLKDAKNEYPQVIALIEKYENYRRKGSNISKEEMSEREQLVREIAKMKTMLRDKALDFAKQIV